MKSKLNEPINLAIMANEEEAYDWPMTDLSIELYWWAFFFNIALFRDQHVPVPAISFERTKGIFAFTSTKFPHFSLSIFNIFGA